VVYHVKCCRPPSPLSLYLFYFLLNLREKEQLVESKNSGVCTIKLMIIVVNVCLHSVFLFSSKNEGSKGGDISLCEGGKTVYIMFILMLFRNTYEIIVCSYCLVNLMYDLSVLTMLLLMSVFSLDESDVSNGFMFVRFL